MQSTLKLYFKWGITFGEPYIIAEKSARKVEYADKDELVDAILREYDDDDCVDGDDSDYEALPIQTSGVGNRLKEVVGGEDA